MPIVYYWTENECSEIMNVSELYKLNDIVCSHILN